MVSRMILSVLVATLVLPALAHAAEVSEQKARRIAIGILKGDPYGRTDAAVAANIHETRATTAGQTVCHGPDIPVWAFRVVVPASSVNGVIDGWLVLDRRNGKLVCAGLPFLD